MGGLGGLLLATLLPIGLGILHFAQQASIPGLKLPAQQCFIQDNKQSMQVPLNDIKQVFLRPLPL